MHRITLILLLLLSACANGSDFTQTSAVQVQSMGRNNSTLFADFSTVVCDTGFANEGEIWMTDIPIEELAKGNTPDGQIIQLQMLWTPIAGKTPLAATSTNLVIKHIIISDGEVGVYGGGGYCWPTGTPSDGMKFNIEQATIAIQDQSSGFFDPLTPATMTGVVASSPDKVLARQIASAARRITQ